MARKATKSATRSRARASSGNSSTGVTRRPSAKSGGGSSRTPDMGEAFIKLLQSPLVAELVAVAATAALAALAEHGFTSGGEASRGKRAGKAVKQAGKAAAAAVGRRLANELDEIRKSAKDGAKA